MPFPNYDRVAGGNIGVYSFVTIVSANPGQCLLASSNTAVIHGISGKGTNAFPGTIGLELTFTDGASNVRALHASQGQNCQVFGPGEKDVLLLLGPSATCNAGDRLTTDANGRGVVTTTAGQELGAIAMETQATAGGLVKVEVVCRVAN